VNGDAVVREAANGSQTALRVPLPGTYQLQNALIAVAVARTRGLAWEEILPRLAAYRPLPMRWEEADLDGIRLVNDAYNANPDSMRAAIEAFDDAAPDARRWLVLGGMLELGDLAREEHAALGAFVAQRDEAGLVAVGEMGGWIAEGARAAGCPPERVAVCDDCEQAARLLVERAAPGDAVLLKASRGFGLEAVVRMLKEDAQ
jgi:UDP-N-acetylmuramoyl-tripeptide--D-alanyl-D-alanine ligase